MLEDYCRATPGGRVWYIHTKGATAAYRNMSCFMAVTGWRRAMEHFVLTR
jgi:hypothetical protein